MFSMYSGMTPSKVCTGGGREEGERRERGGREEGERKEKREKKRREGWLMPNN